MTWFWILSGALAGLAGLRYVGRIRAMRASSGVPRVDDDALRRILAEGTLAAEDGDEPLDLEEAARAEEEFWSESWDEPEEYSR
ncbi:MAG TPA: hypothetical protein VGR37_21095 [Longimicrobiaceae bacterium]|nr:hypothetical protein [Longimicrobiaceae bacterium]